MPALKRSALFAAAALVFAAIELIFAAKHHVLLADYRAFYCGGAALLHGSDPYAASSLYACERAPEPFGLFSAMRGVAVPAPLPGYALLIFVPFAALAYPASAVLWIVVLTAVSAFACVQLARVTALPPSAAIAVFAAAFGIAVLPYGELAAICILALVGMALSLRCKAWNVAAVCAAFSMILPHVGLSAAIAAFLFKREMRLRLIVIAIVLAASDAAAGGAHTALEYFTSVLPAHALAEIGSTTQYGLTWALHGLRVPDRAAILGGEIDYAFMLVAGCALAWAAARRLRDDAYIALVPPALAVFGGSFIHYSEILAAIPACVLLLVNARGALRTLLITAVVLIAFPWGAALTQPLLLFAYAFAGAAIVWEVTGLQFDAALRAGIGCALLTALVLFAASRLGPSIAAHGSGPQVHSALAQASWSEYVRTQRASTGPIWWIVKAPAWIGLAILTLCGAYGIAQKDLVPPVAVEQVPIGS